MSCESSQPEDQDILMSNVGALAKKPKLKISIGIPSENIKFFREVSKFPIEISIESYRNSLNSPIEFDSSGLQYVSKYGIPDIAIESNWNFYTE